MELPFIKMQAIGNDYIIIDGWKYGDYLSQASELAPKMSDRHFGVGGDGIIFVMPSEKADGTMRMFNVDGSEAQMCGNGIRQVAKFLHDSGKSTGDTLRVETLAGVKSIRIMKRDDQGELLTAEVNMGAPILNPKHIPANAEMNREGFGSITLEVPDRKFCFTVVSMGNPHAVAVVENTGDFEVEKYGRIVENRRDVFPERVNVEFIELLTDSEINMRVWERGSGETLACGTGASASVVACVLNRFTERRVTVHLLGGDLEIEWADDHNVYMTGEARRVFEGVWRG